jgi:hypothetical protein
MPRLNSGRHRKHATVGLAVLLGAAGITAMAILLSSPASHADEAPTSSSTTKAQAPVSGGGSQAPVSSSTSQGQAPVSSSGG